MKRVLIDQERMRHPYCGLAYYCRALEQGLRELSDPDIQYAYYGPKKAGYSDTLRWHRWHKHINPTPRGFDLLHVTHQLERYFPHRWGVPRVVTLHDLNYLYEDLSEKKRTKIQRLVEENLSKADAIVCISEFVQKDLEAHRDSLGVKPTTSIHTVHNGVFLPDEARLVALPTEGILPDKPYLLALGVLFDKKQQHLLIEMLPHLPEDLHLVLVYSEAKPEYKAQIDEAIRRTGTAHRIHFYESVSHEVKDALLYHSTALVHPSKAEGFGLPVVEAMALGKPLFLRPMTSLPEIGGDVAYYFDSTEPEDMAHLVQRGLEECTAAPERIAQIKARAQLFSCRKMAEGYSTVYREVLSRTR